MEALIDGLVDYWQEDGFPPSKKSGEEMYWKLAEMGFDAVPTLIEHLNDERLTRTYDVTVGLLCTWLLEDLSGMEIGKYLDRAQRSSPKSPEPGSRRPGRWGRKSTSSPMHS